MDCDAYGVATYEYDDGKPVVPSPVSDDEQTAVETQQSNNGPNAETEPYRGVGTGLQSYQICHLEVDTDRLEYGGKEDIDGIARDCCTT